MKCRVDITAATDIAAWVTREAFIANVDQEDLSCRDSKIVFDYYHPNWFRYNIKGELYFTPPAFVFRDGYLCGVNGRHRAILLFRHLNTIPMLLVNPDKWPESKLAEIALKQINENEIVELPDFPIDQRIWE
jgi:hypothetical protein